MYNDYIIFVLLVAWFGYSEGNFDVLEATNGRKATSIFCTWSRLDILSQHGTGACVVGFLSIKGGLEYVERVNVEEEGAETRSSKGLLAAPAGR